MQKYIIAQTSYHVILFTLPPSLPSSLTLSLPLPFPSSSLSGPPAIINGPVNQKRIEGDSVTFNCFATGDPIPEVIWRFNNSLITTNGSKYSIGDITEGINFGSLTINDVNYYDKGTYECTAANVNGSSSLDVLLEVQGKYTRIAI